MGYNARKKVSVYDVISDYGDYGEEIKIKRLIYTGTQVVCPMTSAMVKKEYGVDTNNPKTVIFNKKLPTDIPLLILIDGKFYGVIERTNFDSFNILLVDEDKGEYKDGE